MGKPRIRFKGYTDEWEEKKLEEVSEFITKGATPTTYGFEWQLSGIPFFRNDAIKNNQFVYGDYSYISEKANEALKRSEIYANDILVAITGDIGKVGIIPKSIEKGNINQHIARVRVTKESDPYFIYQSLCTEGQQRKYQLIKTGLSMPQLSLEQIRKTIVLCPSLSEQKKIGYYFQNLDHLISIYQRKYEEAKILKKYMLQKMFPNKGKNKPEIRFKGFTDAWEQRKLGDVVEFLDTMRKPLDSAKRVSGPYPYYGASGIVDYVDGYLFSEELVLLSEDGANITDRNYPVCFLATGKYWVNNHAHVLRAKKGNENNFICNSLERKDYTQYNTGMAMPKLNKETCQKIPISCTVFEEQKKIGDYFRNLDNLITLHQRKCDKLKKVKKFMLQNMFLQN